MRYKVGDRVRVLGKTAGECLSCTDIKIGDIKYIRDIYTHAYKLSNVPMETALYGIFNHEDLELIEPKFKIADKVSIHNKSAGTPLGEEYSRWAIGDVGFIVEEIGWDDGRREYKYGLNKIKDAYAEKDFFLESDLTPVVRDYGTEDAWTKREVEMKYVSGTKELRVKSLYGQEDVSYIESNISAGENARFVTKMIKDFGYNYGEIVEINEEFIGYVDQHHCFIDWLLKNKYIREDKVFKPFQITLDITSADEYWTLYHRLNIAEARISEDYWKDKTSRPATKANLEMFKSVKSYKAYVL